MKFLGGRGALALALVLAAGTSYAAYRYLEQASVAQPPASTPVEASVTVVTAAKDIPERTVVTADMVKLAELPSNAKLAGTATSLDQVAGKVTREPINATEQVQLNHLYPDRAQSGLTFIVPPGRRAVSVGVNEVVGSGGLIQPGDFVDVVAVVEVSAPAEPQTAGQPSGAQPAAGSAAAPAGRAEMVAASQYIVQNVEVLAVAQNIEGVPAEQSAVSRVVPGAAPPSPQPSAQPQARSVTLSVTPEEAQRLVLAEDKGRIRLVLRPYGDQTLAAGADEGLFTNYRGITILKNAPRPL